MGTMRSIQPNDHDSPLARYYSVNVISGGVAFVRFRAYDYVCLTLHMHTNCAKVYALAVDRTNVLH